MIMKLRIVLYLFALICTSKVFSQPTDTVLPEYLVRRSNIEFHFENSVYRYTLFIESDGRFYFKEGFVLGEPWLVVVNGRSKKKRLGKTYMQVFVSKPDSIFSIESLYPRFITHDSSFINEYPFDYQLIPLINELIYSFLLSSFEESSLYTDENKRAIRVILPDVNIKYPGRNSLYRLEFENAQTLLTFKEGEYDRSGRFNILSSRSCLIHDKDLLKVEKLIDKINFENEYYFLKANLVPKLFVEYKNGKEYYAIKRPSDRGDFIGIYLLLNGARGKCR